MVLGGGITEMASRGWMTEMDSDREVGIDCIERDVDRDGVERGIMEMAMRGRMTEMEL